MRRLKIFSLAFSLAMLAAAPAYAAEAKASETKLPNPVIAIIDVQRILQESLAAKNVQQQLESQRAKFQTEIESEENGLRQAEQDLTKARDQISADAYSEREQQLRQRFLAVERHVQARRKMLDQAFTDSMNAVRASLLDIVDHIAHERGANLVLVKQQALWVDKPLDVTDDVLNRLNAKLPQVAVTMPPEDADAEKAPDKSSDKADKPGKSAK
jgi:Skp family chaperone for outer membrane proteins